MIKINNNELQKFSDEYFNALKSWLNYENDKKPKDKILTITKGNAEKDTLYKAMLQYFHNRFVPNGNTDSIILLKNKDDFQKEIDAFEKRFEKDAKKKKYKKAFGKFKDKMACFYTKFFSTDCKFTDYDGFNNGGWMTKKMDIRTCPYCNRQYTFTITKEKIKGKKQIRPEFDHFFHKSKYPYLALSFYNLIPSCPTCNHIKGEESININPYWEDFQDNNCKFELQNKEGIKLEKEIILDWRLDKKNIKVDFSSENDNIMVFGLRELYNEHTDYVEEIIDKAQAYNSTYYNSLIQSFSGLGKTPAEIDRYVWGNYIETADQCKRPLSKLTKDILEQLDII